VTPGKFGESLTTVTSEKGKRKGGIFKGCLHANESSSQERRREDLGSGEGIRDSVAFVMNSRSGGEEQLKTT